MLVAFRLAGLSALAADYAGVAVLTQSSVATLGAVRESARAARTLSRGRALGSAAETIGRVLAIANVP
jgi:hypothetical protein